MSVGLTGIIKIWFNIIWYTCWPLIITPLIYLFFRKRIYRKYIYLIIGVFISYVIWAIFEFLSPYYLNFVIQFIDSITKTDGIRLSTFIINTAKILSAIILLISLTKWKTVQKEQDNKPLVWDRR